MTEPIEPTEPAPTELSPLQPLQLLAIVLAAAAAILLVSGIGYAFAAAGAMPSGGVVERLRLLGQAANPFIATLALVACVLVARDRRAGRASQAFAGAAIGIAATVAVATVLLALNAFVLDFSGRGTFDFRLSAAVSRIATLLLAAHAVWVAATERG